MSDDKVAKKKPRGRPVEKRYPPRIDATPEELARVVLNGGRPKARVKSRTYRCGTCGRAVYYPETVLSRGAIEGDGICRSVRRSEAVR